MHETSSVPPIPYMTSSEPYGIGAVGFHPALRPTFIGSGESPVDPSVRPIPEYASTDELVAARAAMMSVFGMPRSNTANTFYKRISTTIPAVVWSGPNNEWWHEQWQPGRVVLVIAKITPPAPTATIIAPASSGPGASSASTKTEEKSKKPNTIVRYDSAMTKELNSICITPEQYNAFVSLGFGVEGITLFGVCDGQSLTSIPRATARIPVVVSSSCRCINYWGDSVYPNAVVGFAVCTIASGRTKASGKKYTMNTKTAICPCIFQTGKKFIIVGDTIDDVSEWSMTGSTPTPTKDQTAATKEKLDALETDEHMSRLPLLVESVTDLVVLGFVSVSSRNYSRECSKMAMRPYCTDVLWRVGLFHDDIPQNDFKVDTNRSWIESSWRSEFVDVTVVPGMRCPS